MSYDIVQDLVDQLEDKKPGVRIRALRRLAAIGDPRAVPEISNVYLNEDERPEVKKVAREALGTFQAIREAIDQQIDVELPDPSTVKDPLISPEMLRRLLIGLAALMVVFWVVDVVLLLLPPSALATQDALAILQSRYARVRADAEHQGQAWQSMRDGGPLDCNIPAPAPGSTNSRDLAELAIEGAVSSPLPQARQALVAAIDQLAVPAGNWLVGCNANIFPMSANQNLEFVARALVLLDDAADLLAQAGALPPITPGQPTEPLSPGPPPAATATESPGGPTLEPTPAFDPSPYIRGMRERIDVVMGGRGVGTLLPTFWEDVRRTGQSFGCRQALSADDLIDYTLVTPAIAALEPRLQNAAITLNVGLALARDSLRNFQQGCSTGNFGPLLDVGQEQARQAVSALNQAAALLDQLQAELRSRQ